MRGVGCRKLFISFRRISKEVFPLVVGILTICLTLREDQIEFIVSLLAPTT